MVDRPVSHAVRVSNHTCHWPGCLREVPPRLWGCKQHWYQLPAHLRHQIWRTYRPGQEVDKTPSREYLDAARAVQSWIESTKNPPPRERLLKEPPR